jgi:hypothetical protein
VCSVTYIQYTSTVFSDIQKTGTVLSSVTYIQHKGIVFSLLAYIRVHPLLGTVGRNGSSERLPTVRVLFRFCNYSGQAYILNTERCFNQWPVAPLMVPPLLLNLITLTTLTSVAYRVLCYLTTFCNYRHYKSSYEMKRYRKWWVGNDVEGIDSGLC